VGEVKRVRGEGAESETDLWESEEEVEEVVRRNKSEERCVARGHVYANLREKVKYEGTREKTTKTKEKVDVKVREEPKAKTTCAREKVGKREREGDGCVRGKERREDDEGKGEEEPVRK
jgi:hypothetical protein